MHFVARSPLDFGWGIGKIVAGVYYGYCFGGSAFMSIVATWLLVVTLFSVFRKHQLVKSRSVQVFALSILSSVTLC